MLITRDVYIHAVLDNIPRLLGLLNRNISSSSYGSFDREYWHYSTVDFSNARKQEAVLTLSMLYRTDHEKNIYFRSSEILSYIRAALLFWTKIQGANGSFNEWYPHEHSFVVTSFSMYAVSESLMLMKDDIPEDDYNTVLASLVKAGQWLLKRNEPRVMNQQTGAAIALLNLHILTGEDKYLQSSREKIALLEKRQSYEGWFLEYGGPDIGYLSLAIDYLCKYHSKTSDPVVEGIIDKALEFIQHFIHPGLVAGGEYTSRNTEYLIPHGFEIYSRLDDNARFIASVVRKSLLKRDSFPHLFDDRYLTYVGYTWLQAYADANPEIDNTAEQEIIDHFSRPYKKHFKESGLLIINDDIKHFIINLKKGGAFRLYDKKDGKTYSDSGLLIHSEGVWYTAGWLSDTENSRTENSISIAGNMWKVPDKTMSPLQNILLRIFQMTCGRSSTVSLWMKERLRDFLITETKPSSIRYNRDIRFPAGSDNLMEIEDSAAAENNAINTCAVFAKDTHIYVPSSRYYCEMKHPCFRRDFPSGVRRAQVRWTIKSGQGARFDME